MKRRRFIQALAVAPAAPALLAQQAAPAGTPAAEAALDFAIPDDAAQPVLRFFTASEFATLQRLSEILMPGALQGEVPEFMDFLIGDAPAQRQQLWRNGLDALELQAQNRFGKSFAGADAAQTEMLLAPLRQPWISDSLPDPMARFLVAAKLDIRTATLNAPARNPVAPGSRRRGGGGLYWLPVE